MRENVPGHFVRNISVWRRLAMATWGPANDPTIYGQLQIDATRALELVRKTAEDTGLRVTLTHLVVQALARTLARHPECNAYVRRGRLYQRDRVDVFVLVAVPPADGERQHEARADLNGVKLERADTLTLAQIAEQLTTRVRETRSGADRDFARIKRVLDWVPPALLSAALGGITFAQYELNLDLSKLGVPRDAFGGAFVTSVGPLGLRFAFAPIVPFTRLSVNIAVGRVEDGPFVEGGQLVVRPILPITATFDHRVIDGYHAARLSETFTKILRDPAAHLT